MRVRTKTVWQEMINGTQATEKEYKNLKLDLLVRRADMAGTGTERGK